MRRGLVFMFDVFYKTLFLKVIIVFFAEVAEKKSGLTSGSLI